MTGGLRGPLPGLTHTHACAHARTRTPGSLQTGSWQNGCLVFI